MDTTDRTEPEAAFSRCWRGDMPRVLRYVQRHVGPDDALDVTAEVFTVAWRRWSEVPEPALPWLIGVARRVIANSRRTLSRRHRLHSQLQFLHEVTRDHAEPVDPTDKLEAVRRLAGLSDVEREAVLLVAWDGLSSVEAAHVLGLNPATFRKRLSRARRALQAGHPDIPVPPHPLTLETP